MVVDDHTMFREAMCVALSQYPNINVPYQAASGEEALKLLEDRQPDVILMDISLPGISGIETTRRVLESRYVPIIALSMHAPKAYAAAARAAGAVAYALKAEPLDDLVELIEQAAASERVCEQD